MLTHRTSWADFWATLSDTSGNFGSRAESLRAIHGSPASFAVCRGLAWIVMAGEAAGVAQSSGSCQRQFRCPFRRGFAAERDASHRDSAIRSTSEPPWWSSGRLPTGVQQQYAASDTNLVGSLFFTVSAVTPEAYRPTVTVNSAGQSASSSFHLGHHRSVKASQEKSATPEGRGRVDGEACAISQKVNFPLS